MIETGFEIGGKSLFISQTPRIVGCPDHDIKISDAGETYIETYIDVEVDVTLGVGGETVTFDYTTSYILDEDQGRKELRWAGNIFNHQVDKSKTDEQIRRLFSVELTSIEAKGLAEVIRDYAPSLDSLGFTRNLDDYVYQVTGDNKWLEYKEVSAQRKLSGFHLVAMRPKTSHSKIHLKGVLPNTIGGTSASIRFDPLLSYNAIKAIKKSLNMERLEGGERMAYLGFKVAEIRAAMSQAQSMICQSMTEDDRALINSLEEGYVRFL